MHYIIGTSFRVPTRQEQTVRPSAISSASQGSTTANSAREWADFDPGHTYTLYNIQKVNEGVQYIFRSQSGAAEVTKVFESANVGDNYISRVKLESLPNYNTFYENRND